MFWATILYKYHGSGLLDHEGVGGEGRLRFHKNQFFVIKRAPAPARTSPKLSPGGTSRGGGRGVHLQGILGDVV